MFSRGKLHFLSAKDDRIKLINERINLTEKHLIEICQSFATCSRRLAKYRDAYDELAKKFYNYGEEEEIEQSLMDGIKKMSNVATILGDHMDLNVQRLEFKIVNELALFDTLCKSTRDNLRMAVSMRDKEVYKQKQLLQIKSKFSPHNTSTDSELLKGKLEVRRTNKEIDKIIVNFEKRKLYNLKVILNDFILITMKCHAKSLEVLTECYNDLKNIDEVDDLRIFRKIIKTKWDDIDVISQKKNGMKENARNNLSKSMEDLNHYEISSSPLKIDKKLSFSVKSMDEIDADSNSIEDDNDEDDDDDDDDDDNDDDDNDDTNLSDSDKNENSENDDKNRDKNTKKVVKHNEFRNAKQVHENVFHVTNLARVKNSYINSKVKEPSINRNKHMELKGKDSIRRGGGSGKGGDGDAGHQVTFVESNKVEKETTKTNEAIIDCTRAARL